MLVATALGVVLSGSPLTVVGTNSISSRFVGTANGGVSWCQMSGTLARGTSAIRISAAANTGPRVTVKVLSGAAVVTQGERDAGWGSDKTVTVPVKRVPRTIPNADICIAFGPAIEPIPIHGVLVQSRGVSVQRTTASGRTEGVARLRVEFLRGGHASWWSLAPSVARRMGLGHAPSGTWIVFVLIALMIMVTTLAARLVLRELGTHQRPAAGPGQIVRRIPTVLRRIPRAAWICALVASLSAACWSVITPPFQAPDEPAHFAYVQQLAQTGTLPTSGTNYSEEEEVALRDLRQQEVRFYPEHQPVATLAEQQRLENDLALPLARTGEGGAGVAAGHPPLYYTLEAIPYWLGSSGSLLDRLELMRLLSALMAGLTAFFAYLFVREALPGAPWAWAVGGLGVALAPLLGFMSGVVNPDAMLAAVSAAIFYCLARAFRRGLTRRLAIVIGVLTAIGFLTKLNFIGLAPGVLLGVIVLSAREARSAGRSAYVSLAWVLAIAISPVCVYIVINLFSQHPGLGMLSSDINHRRGSVFGGISYIWQSYLPRLPGLANDFPGVSTTRQMWFDRLVGFYGWLDTSFPVWVDNIAVIPAVLLTILGIRELVKVRAALRRRLVELAVYAAIGAGLLVMIGVSSYLEPAIPGTYSEPRYLLPLLALLGAALVLSARGAGRRFGPAVGAVIVVLFLAHDVFSQLQVIARFHG